MATAVLVFFVAPDITILDLAGKSIKEQNNELTLLKSTRDTIQNFISTKKVPVNYSLSQFEYSHGASPTIMYGGYTRDFIPDHYPNFVEIAHQLTDIITDLSKTADGKPISISLPTIYGTYISAIMPAPLWITFIDGLSKLPMPFDEIERTKLNNFAKGYRDLSDKIDHLEKVNNEIEHYQIHKEASRAEGVDTDTDRAIAGGKIRLIQTSVTRFGTLAVIIFLVSIISGLYRYTVKLAAFYLAQADALILLGPATTSTEFSAFSSTLTPKLDFGREPSTPVEQVTQLADAASRLLKKAD